MLMVKHLCRYLLGLPVLATEVKKPDGSGILEGIVDSDWQGCQDTRKSTSGYVLVWEGSVISVGSATQSGVPSLSSAEAELKAAIYGEKEMMLAESLIKFLGFEIKSKIIWTDSSAARSVMTRLGTGSKMKHLQAAELYLQEKVRMKELEVLKCSTNWNPADVLTKFVSEELMKKYLGLMGMVVWDDSEVVSTCVENTYGGRFSTNTMRTWFKRTMVLGMMGTVKASRTTARTPRTR